MSGDERGTLRLLASHREIADREIGQHGGRIANTAGDSILAEFPNALDAVRCALAVQERIAAVNDAVPQGTLGSSSASECTSAKSWSGMATSSGTVSMLLLACRGWLHRSVCLSEAAHAYVQRLLPLAFEDIGSQPVKGIDHPSRLLTHPAHHLSSKAVPLVHSQFDGAHSGRQFNRLCMAALNEIASTVALNAIDIQRLRLDCRRAEHRTSPLGRTDGHRDVRSAANYNSPGSARFHRTRALRRRTAFRHVVSSDAVRGGDTLAAPRCRAGGTRQIVSAPFRSRA